MPLVTQTEFAELCGCSRAFITKSVQNGSVIKRNPKKGEPAKIDTDLPLNNEFMKMTKERSEARKQNKKEDKPVKQAPKVQEPDINQEEIEDAEDINLDDIDINNLSDITKLTKNNLEKIKILETIRKQKQDREIKRGDYVDKVAVMTILAKIFEIHMNEFLTTSDKLAPDLASVFGVTEQIKIIEARNVTEETLYKTLQRIKSEINNFLNKHKVEKI